jgi:uncharacterized protein YdeI (YjbR/CyaY-like superfamily)
MTTDAAVTLLGEPRVLAVPPDLAAALEREDDVLRSFERLSYRGQAELVLSVDRARTGQSRRRRIARALGLLREGWAQ